MWIHTFHKADESVSVISAISNQTRQVQNAAVITCGKDVAQIYEFWLVNEPKRPSIFPAVCDASFFSFPKNITLPSDNVRPLKYYNEHRKTPL